MEKLIAFKKGVSSLNDNEYKQFIDLFGRNDITKLLFQGMLVYINKDAAQYAHTANQIVSTIIRSRNHNKQRNHPTNDDEDEDEDIDIASINTKYSSVNVAL